MVSSPNVLILPARGPKLVKSNLRTRTILMHGVAPQMCQSGSPSIVRRRSRRSLPRLHPKLNDFWHLTPLRRRLFASQGDREPLRMGGNGDQLVRLANGVRLVDNDRCRHCNFLFADNTPRRQPWRLARRGAFGHTFCTPGGKPRASRGSGNDSRFSDAMLQTKWRAQCTEPRCAMTAIDTRQVDEESARYFLHTSDPGQYSESLCGVIFTMRHKLQSADELRACLCRIPDSGGLFGRSFFDLMPFQRTESVFRTVPSVDVAETDKAYEITAELPGLN